MNISVKVKDVLSALEKMAVAVGDGFEISIRKKQSAEGKYFLSIRGCNGQIQSQTTIFCDVSEELVEDVSFAVEKSLLNVVKGLDFENEIILDKQEKMLFVRTSNVVVPLALIKKEKLISIQALRPDKVPSFAFCVNGEIFNQGIKQACMGCDMTNSDSQFADALFVSPRKKDDGNVLELFCNRPNGAMLSGTVLPINVEETDYFAKTVENKRIISLPASFFVKVGKFFRDDCQIFVFDSQVIVRNDLDVYVIVPKKTKSSLDGIRNIIFTGNKKEETIILNCQEAKKALAIATLNREGDDSKCVILLGSGNKIKVASMDCNNVVTLENGDISGDVVICFRKEFLSNYLNSCNEEQVKLSIFKKDKLIIIYVITSDSSEYAFLPIIPKDSVMENCAKLLDQ